MPVATSSSSKSTRCQSPPRFSRALPRAFSTRIRRIASAAAAKKWPRLFQWATSPLTPGWAAPSPPKGRGESVSSPSCEGGGRGGHQAQIGLVDQGRRLERLAGFLVGKSLGRELAEFIVNQRQELLRGGGIALLDGGEHACDVGHAWGG